MVYEGSGGPVVTATDGGKGGESWGASHALALVLASLQLDVVSRVVLHHIISARGVTSSRGHTRRTRVRDALVRFEQRGWITRGDRTIRIHKRRALIEYATKAAHDPDDLATLRETVRHIRDAYNRQAGTPKAAQAGRQRRQYARLATEPPKGPVLS